MADQKYYLKITMEAGSYDNDRPYQKTVLEQNYATQEQQVSEQMQIFPAVQQAVGAKLVELGAEFNQKSKGQTDIAAGALR